MAQTIKLKRGTTTPTTSNIVSGEVAIDTSAQKLYVNDAGTIKSIGGISNVVEDTTPQLGGALDTNGNDINFADNVKANFGASSDLQIYHDGVNSYIAEAGTGNLKLTTDGTSIQLQTSTAENMLVATPNAAVQLFYDNGIKLATTSTGVSVTGNAEVSGQLLVSGGYGSTGLTITGSGGINANANILTDGIVYASGGNSGNWNTAYGWGDHASGGYAPTASPTFTGTTVISGLTYPTSDGTSGQVLTTNGSGTLSFTTVSGGGLTQAKATAISLVFG